MSSKHMCKNISKNKEKNTKEEESKKSGFKRKFHGHCSIRIMSRILTVGKKKGKYCCNKGKWQACNYNHHHVLWHI